MTLAAVENTLLIHELQLGEKLNESIHDARRSDFSLLLAMLTDDVREHSQFLLPATEEDVESSSESQLRKAFNLPEPAPIALDSLDDIMLFNEASFVENNDLAHIKLVDSLTPKPIAFRDDKDHIPSDVMKNTSLYCQTKYKQNNVSDVLQKKMDFEASGWLKAIDHQIANDPLINTVA